MTALLLPGQEEPMTQGWEIAEELENAVDAVIDSGDCGTEPTTVIDFSHAVPSSIPSTSSAVGSLRRNGEGKRRVTRSAGP